MLCPKILPSRKLDLTEVAGEGGPDLAPQKFLLSQKFRHLMRCKKYLNKISKIPFFIKMVFYLNKYYLEYKIIPTIFFKILEKFDFDVLFRISLLQKRFVNNLIIPNT